MSDLIKITLRGKSSAVGPLETADVRLPVIPKVGEYVDHEPSGIKGDIRGISYNWDADGRLFIEVDVR